MVFEYLMINKIMGTQYKVLPSHYKTRYL